MSQTMRALFGDQEVYTDGGLEMEQDGELSGGGHWLNQKLINDPVHGYINVTDRCFDFIDTPQFQRLRDLKQLGSSYFVWPGGSHNRFEHCIGVSYLAGELTQIFQRNQPYLDISERDIENLRIAGLCHDIGHGPFSHVFDSEFVPRVRPELAGKWHHEDMSCDMIRWMVDDNNIDMEKEDVEFVCDLIKGNGGARKYDEKKYLFEIVANSRTSVDVDKFDYLKRDSLNLGVPTAFDHTVLMKNCKVIGDEICFHRKSAFTLYQMFHTRYSLFKQVYSHRVGKAIEYMIVDALVAANDFLSISDAIDNPDQYLTLTDHVLREIEFSAEPELQESRDIIKRIRKRNLYKFVNEFMLTEQDAAKVWDKDGVDLAADICSCQGPQALLSPEELIVNKYSLNYGMGKSNPVDGISFFADWENTKTFKIQKEKLSKLMPSQFNEKFVRLYIRDRDEDKLREAKLAFSNWHQRQRMSHSPVPFQSSTPRKRGRRSRSNLSQDLGTSSSSSSSSSSVTASLSSSIADTTSKVSVTRKRMLEQLNIDEEVFDDLDDDEDGTQGTLDGQHDSKRAMTERA